MDPISPPTRTPVLIAGLPGRMAAETAELVAAADDFELLPLGITSPSRDGESAIIGSHPLSLVGTDKLASLAVPDGAIAIDYTTPDAALANIAWYVERGMPFVMGTTGFDTAEARRLVEGSSISAVIAPNMATPIVLLQAAGRYLAEQFPGALAGSDLSIRESHQATKRDTSGTAKALLGFFSSLGLASEEEQIEKVRDPQRQRDELAIPEEHLGGHAFHRYEVATAADTVQLVLEHNVLGRRVYAEGTVAALRFLASRLTLGPRGEVFSMEDVLRSCQ